MADVDGRLSDKEHLDRLQKRWQFNHVICDPAGSSMIAEASSRGLMTSKGKNDIDKGVAAVNNALHRGLMKIDGERCLQTLMVAASYEMNQVTDKPIKNGYEHPWDAIRYGTMYFHPARGFF